MVRKIKPTKEERQASQPKVDEPDEFLSQSQRIFDWMADHSKGVMMVMGGLLLVGIAYSSASGYGKHIDAKASTLLAEVVRAQRGQVDLTGELKAEPGKDPVFASEQAKSQAVRESAEALVKAYPSHQVGVAGRLYLGNACLNLDEVVCALDAFRTAADLSGPEDLLRNSALLGLAAAYEQKGEDDQAVKTYSEVADGKLAFRKDVGLYHGARLLAAKHDERAKGYLERIESDFPESVYKTDAASLLDSLK